jgi:hypothetical protein
MAAGSRAASTTPRAAALVLCVLALLLVADVVSAAKKPSSSSTGKPAPKAPAPAAAAAAAGAAPGKANVTLPALRGEQFARRVVASDRMWILAAIADDCGEPCNKTVAVLSEVSQLLDGGGARKHMVVFVFVFVFVFAHPVISPFSMSPTCVHLRAVCCLSKTAAVRP